MSTLNGTACRTAAGQNGVAVSELVAGTTVPHPASAPIGTRRLRLCYDTLRVLSRLRFLEPELCGLAAVVPRGGAALDVGASLGLYTLPLAHLVGATGRVDSFEPQPRGYRVTRAMRRAIGASRGRLQRVAVGAEPGHGAIAVPLVRGLVPIFGHGHLTAGAAERDGVRLRHTETEIITLDAWVATEGIDRVAFIKMDVEGFEPAVIEGAAQVITRDLPTMLLEIEDRHLARYGTNAAGFTDGLLARWPEYRMLRWDGRRWSPAARVDDAGNNYLFATRDVVPD